MSEFEPHLLRKDYNLGFDQQTREFVVKFGKDWFRTENGMDVIRYILRKQEIKYETQKLFECDCSNNLVW